MHIETIVRGIRYLEQELSIHIDSTESFVFEIKDLSGGSTELKHIKWHVFHNGEQVDENDFTGGTKAELRLSKIFAGTCSKPSLIDISATTNRGETLGQKQLEISTDPEIKEAVWIVRGMEGSIADNFENVSVLFDGYGLFGQDLIVDIFNVDDKNQAVYTEKVTKKSSGGMITWLARNNDILIKKFFFKISYYEYEKLVTLYDGMAEGNTLSVISKYFSIPPIDAPTNLTPITIFSEQYFTQKYEPCKYSIISVEIEGEDSVTIFDEEETENKPTNNLFNNLLVGNNPRKLIISLEDTLETEECHAEDEGYESHTNNVFNTQYLDEIGIESNDKGGELSILKLAYPFKFLNDDEYWKFFLFYNPLILPWHKLPLSIPIETCRYSKELTLSLIPDISWAFHFQWGNPKERLYNEEFLDTNYCHLLDYLQGNKLYYEEVSIDLVRGATDIIEAVEEFKKKYLWMLNYINPSHKVITSYLKATSEDFATGIHAYHSYDQEGKNPTVIDFTNHEDFKWIAKIIILGAAAVGIIVDLLLLYFTRGKNLPVVVAKLQKVYKYTRTAVGILGANTYNFDDEGIKFISPQLATYSGIGTKRQEDGTLSIMCTKTLTAAPLFAVNYINKRDIGEFISSILGIKGMFEKFHKKAKIAGYIEMALGFVKKKDLKAKSGIKFGSVRNVRDTAYYIEDWVESKINSTIKELFGAEASMVISFEGFYDAHIQLSTNVSRETMSLYDGISHYLNQSEVTFGKKQGIKATVKLDAKLVKKVALSKRLRYLPKFLNDWKEEYLPDVAVVSELEASLKGSLHFERTFTYNAVTATVATLNALLDKAGIIHPKNKQEITKTLIKNGNLKMPHYHDNYIFTGIIGEILVITEFQVNEKSIWNKKKSKGKDAEGNYKPIVIELIPHFIIKGTPSPVFDLEK